MSYWLAGATAVSVISSGISASKGRKAAKKSAKIQAAARQEASNMLGQFSNQLKADYSPYAALGTEYMPMMYNASRIDISIGYIGICRIDIVSMWSKSVQITQNYWFLL